jgi:hypothetical protein
VWQSLNFAVSGSGCSRELGGTSRGRDLKNRIVRMSKKNEQKKKERERRVAKEKLAESARRKALSKESEKGPPKNRSSKILSAAVPKTEVPVPGKGPTGPRKLGG